MSSNNPVGAYRFAHVAHPHVARHERRKPVKVADLHGGGLNGRIALALTKGVGTMWCAYAFVFLAVLGFPLGANVSVRDYVQWVSQTFIQLVMLSVIMVGQNILSAASDKRAEETYNDADATFALARRIQDHLDLQDQHLSHQDDRLEKIIRALREAYPQVGIVDGPSTDAAPGGGA